MIRIASIGYGDIAQRERFPQVRRLGERASLVAIAGRDPDRLADCGRRFGVPRLYTDVDRMLDEDDIDAVLILTPPDSHADLATKAVRAGKHVLLEKPMVLSMAEADQVRAAVADHPVVFEPLPHVASATYDRARRLIADGAIGEVTSVDCHKSHRGPTHAGWFYDSRLAGGGALFDLGVYAIGGVVDLLGPAARLEAMCARRFPTRTLDDGTVIEPDVEDIAVVTLWLRREVAAVINANWTGYLSHHRPRSRTTIYGREGMLHVGVPDGGLYLHRDDEKYERFGSAIERVDFDGYPSVRIGPDDDAALDPVARFVQRIEDGDTDTTPLARQAHIMEIMLATYDTGALGRSRELRTTC